MPPSTALQKILLISLLAFGNISQAGVVSAGTNIWTSIGPEGGIIQALAINPATATTLCAGTDGGLFPIQWDYYLLTVIPARTASGIVTGNGINCAWNGSTSSGTCSGSTGRKYGGEPQRLTDHRIELRRLDREQRLSFGLQRHGGLYVQYRQTSGVYLEFTIGGHIYLPLILRN